MNIETVREYVLSLPGVTEDQPFGDDNVTFRIEGKIFMCLWLGGKENNMKECEPRFALKLAPERNEILREKSLYVTPAYHWNKKHWSDIFFTHFDRILIKSWIHESYLLVVSQLPKNKRGLSGEPQ